MRAYSIIHHFMETALLIARIAAVLYLCAGLGALFNQKYVRSVIESYIGNPGLEYLGALFALILGFLMITGYNVWVWHWSVAVTIMGWAALVKGMFFLVFPTFTNKMIEKFLKMNLMGVFAPVCILLGLFLGYFGFVAIQ